MLKGYEILGTNKVILEEKENNLFSFRELLALREKLADYEVVAYLEVKKFGQLFFEPMYQENVTMTA
uniref:Uncharacterized protein n=1 Tax=Aeromonas sp. Ne-1 TaxID=1675689 RepID=A0A0H4JD25_9GAMM|nr:hypothetical protein [Aeromonas sp. Ne-1]AKO69687.1 hypothetical protein [Aeromonas sp. Ne-1]